MRSWHWSCRSSTRLGRTSARSAEQGRAVDPKKLGQVLKGDLEWIVMKCLEKDRTRRYETANGVAMDTRRYLDGDGIVTVDLGAFEVSAPR